jgi:hypothetical protein
MLFVLFTDVPSSVLSAIGCSLAAYERDKVLELRQERCEVVRLLSRGHGQQFPETEPCRVCSVLSAPHLLPPKSL